MVASTFKIPNTLIALQEKIVSSKKSGFKWSGKIYDVESWNSDQTLESAFKLSCVWCYQRLALQIGSAMYRKHLKLMSYGKLPMTFDVRHFWLDGSLELNSVEQVNFLKKVFVKNFPYEEEVYGILKDLMLVEKSQNYSLYAKTGWSPYGEDPVAWYVGYIETKQDTWFFATNLAIKESKDLHLRKSLTLKALETVGAISI